MKFLIVGHSIVDHFEKNEFMDSYPGGVFYTALGFLVVSNKHDEIFLVTGISEDSFHLFEKIYSKVSLEFANRINSLPEVFLHLHENKERDELYKNLSSQLNIDKIKDWKDFDGILINMTTGFDISLEQLYFIRKNFLGPIYFDVHTLARGLNENMKRDFRIIPHADKWLGKIDILQTNENELKMLKDVNAENVIEFVFDCGVKILIVTKGGEGAEAFFKINNDIKKIFVEADKTKIVNTVGCGDIFGAVFFYSYLYSNSIELSLERAVELSGKSVSKSANEKIELINDKF